MTKFFVIATIIMTLYVGACSSPADAHNFPQCGFINGQFKCR